MKKPSRSAVALACLAVLATSGVGGSAGAGLSAPPPPAIPATLLPACGKAGPPPSSYQHVVWIFMENRPYSGVIGNTRAPFETMVAQQCGSASQALDNVLPSLNSGPNYLAYTSGANCDDGRLANVPGTPGCITANLTTTKKGRTAAPSVYGAVASSGRSWRAYAEAMPVPCGPQNSGLYALRHNPAPFYSSLTPEDCAANNLSFPIASCSQTVVSQPCVLPLSPNGLADDIAAGALATFTTITPANGNNMHQPGATQGGDNWLAAYLPLLVAGPNYQAGDTVILVVWDEGSEGGGATMPLLVIAPTVPSGRSSPTPTNAVGVLWNTQKLLGLAHDLGCTNPAATPCPAGSTNDLTGPADWNLLAAVAA